MNKPVRKVISRGHAGFRVKLPSKKMKSVIRCESILESKAALLFEYHPNIDAYYAQPCTEIVVDAGGKTHSYTPDFKIVFRDGTSAYIEVKPSKKLQNAKVASRLAVIEKALQARGIRFRVLTDIELVTSGRAALLKQLHSAFRIPIAEEHKRKLCDSLEMIKPRRFGDLSSCFGRTVALKLIASGIVRVPFDRPVKSDTPLLDLPRLGGCDDSLRT